MKRAAVVVAEIIAVPLITYASFVYAHALVAVLSGQ